MADELIIEKYMGKADLKLATLSFMPAEVVQTAPNDEIRVPASLRGTTKIEYQGLKPYQFKQGDGQGNFVLRMPERTVMVVTFTSESGGRFVQKTKIYTSKE